MTMSLDMGGIAAVQPKPGGQTEFCADWTHTFVGLEGGWAGGKTWCGARKLATLHIHNAFDGDGQATFVRSAVVAPTYKLAADICVPELNKAFDEAGLRHEYRSSGSIADGGPAAPAIILPDLGTRKNPSIVLIRTSDKPEHITGWEVGAFWCDEAARWKRDRTDPKKDPITQIMGRLRAPKANLLQGLFTYTNEGDLTRVYELFHSGKPDFALYRARTADNDLVKDFYDLSRREMSPELAEQYLEGGAMQLRGNRMYSSFDQRVHEDKALTLRPELPLQISLDFNINPGMVMEIGQYDEARDQLTVVHELFERNASVDRIFAMFKLWVQQQGGFKWPEVQVFGDPAMSARDITHGQSSYQLIGLHLDAMKIPYRMRVAGNHPPIIDRVNAFNNAMIGVGGSVHWRVHPRCERLILDLNKMRFDDRGEPDKSNRELSHASDAEGYRVHYLRPVRRARLTEVGGQFGV